MSEIENKIRAKAYEYLARREHSVLELYNKLNRYFRKDEEWTEMETAIPKVIDQLREDKSLSNQRFTEMMVREQLRRERGPRLINQKLRQKGIPQAMWLDVWESDNTKSESEICRAALTSWMKRKCLNKLTTEKEVQKAIRFLQQRGFYTSTIYAIISECKSNCQ